MRPARTPEQQERITAMIGRVREQWAMDRAARDGAKVEKPKSPEEQLEETRARVAVDFPKLSEEALAICKKGMEQ